MLLGLTGPAQSGKDTVYAILRAMSFESDSPLGSLVVRRDAFADRLKVSAAKALGFDGSWEDCIEKMNLLKIDGSVISLVGPYKRKEISGRGYLQCYGTEAHRDVFGQQFWIKAVLPEGYPSDTERENTLLVITDVRFENEADRVRECGGVVWKIDRSIEGIAESAHASEQPLPDHCIDHVIRNDRNLDRLEHEVHNAVRRSLGVLV